MRRVYIILSLLIIAIAGVSAMNRKNDRPRPAVNPQPPLAVAMSGKNDQPRPAVNAQPPLAVEIKIANAAAHSAGIELNVLITNNSDADFELKTTTKFPLFTLRVLNEQGADLNQNQFRGFSKDRTNKAGPPVIFKPHQTLTFPVKLETYLNQNGVATKIPAGQYHVSAHLPIVSYGGEVAKVQAIDSEPVTVIFQ